MPMNRPFVRFIAAVCLLLSASAALGAPRRILYVTATYGFRHTDSIDASVEVMQQLARESGVLEIVHTEDVSLLTATYLKSFDAVYFFTSGELPLSDQQKADLLEFVRQGKGFGGSHSATDCLYTWPEYGDMIGGYFDGHPWAPEAVVDVEDPQNPLVTASRARFPVYRRVLSVPRVFARSGAGASHARHAIGEHDAPRESTAPMAISLSPGFGTTARAGCFIVPLGISPGVSNYRRFDHAAEGAALAHRRNRCGCYAAFRAVGAATFDRLPTACAISPAPAARSHPATSFDRRRPANQRIPV